MPNKGKKWKTLGFMYFCPIQNESSKLQFQGIVKYFSSIKSILCIYITFITRITSFNICITVCPAVYN